MKDRFKLPVIVAAAGFMLGLLGTVVWSAERIGDPGVRPALADLTRMEVVRVLPRTELLLLSVEAWNRIDAGRPWAAWRLLEDNMDDPAEAPAEAVLASAEAASRWGGWSKVGPLLEEQPWLTRVEDGRGLFLLARASEELGDADAAIAAYRRYVAAARGRDRGIAYARLGGLLRAAGDARAAASAFGQARADLPQIEDWLLALQAEQLAVVGDRSAIALARGGSAGSAPVRLKRVQAEAVGLKAAGRTEEAAERLAREIRVLEGQGAAAEASQLRIDRARLMLELGRHDEARDLLRAVAWEDEAAAGVRRDAADLLGGAPGADGADHLARAAALEAAERPGLAARALRSALAAGASDGAAIRLRVARLLYAERDYGPARSAFLAAADRLDDPELAADARLHAARSLFRTGGRSRSQALEEMRHVTEAYPGTAAAGTAHFLLGDEAGTLQAALSHYRRAAQVEHSDDAREALYRAGDRSLKLDDPAGAIRHWEAYVARYPSGDPTARVAYEAGRIHERAGRQAQARAMYTAAMNAEPISYYAIRASNRLGVDPLGTILTDETPWAGLATDPVVAGNVLRRLDALADVGLTREWQSELDASLRGFARRPAALVVLGEGLRTRNRPLEAIRIGYRLRELRGGQWDGRSLRLVFPYPYRELLEQSARREGVDPSLLAGLVRQESTFRPAARSWVGATGLGQIMPTTGAWLAPSVGIRGYEEKLLEAPEVNLRMSAKYIGDLVGRYDGAYDLALAGYNAGPSRADRWRRTLGYGRDKDTFRESIPFDETRDYVKIVIRNAAIYERLYYPAPPEGLVRTAD